MTNYKRDLNPKILYLESVVFHFIFWGGGRIFVHLYKSCGLDTRTA